MQFFNIINVIDDSAPRINENSTTISMTVDDQLKAIAEKLIKLEQNSLSQEQFEKNNQSYIS